MPVPVVILHGYGGDSEGWRDLARKLMGEVDGPVSHVYLSDFKTKEDDLIYGDFSEGLDRELHKQRVLGELGPRSFSLIAHSTGSLVVRHWLQRYYAGAPERIPLKNLVLLAPANFGSRLAHHGNSELGRFLHFLSDPRYEGWETGRNVLDGLELASPFTFNLADGDILLSDPRGSNPRVFNAEGLYVYVVIGNEPYGGRIEKRFPARAEAGSDGTVRIAAAALDTRKLRVNFMRNEFSATPGGSLVPLAVVPGVNHSTVKSDDRVFDLVLDALKVENDDDFDRVSRRFAEVRRTTLNGSGDPRTHEYQQFVVHVTDDSGRGVPDYDFDFEAYDAQGREDTDLSDALNETKRHTHTYGSDSSYRCFFIDYTVLASLISQMPVGHCVNLSMIAKDPSSNISYETSDTTRVQVVGPEVGRDSIQFFQGSITTLVDVIIDRKAREELFAVNLWQP